MGKRKHKHSQQHVRRKIRKLEERLQKYRSLDSDSSYNSEPDNYQDLEERLDPFVDLSDSEACYTGQIKSAVHMVNDHTDSMTGTQNVEPVPSTSQQTNDVATGISDTPILSLPTDILDLLGEPKGKLEVLGPKIHEDVSKRWGRILCEGLNKDQKKVLTEKFLVPENFQLVKAPKLNAEIATVLNESVRNRDKRLERSQNYLGVGISAITDLLCCLIEKDVDKNELIKRLSEANQVLLDLHFENTLNRRKLITYALDKKFLDIISDSKRDSFLFGDELTEKIKASKTAERSGLQIKKVPDATTSRKPATSLNWRGPPHHVQRGGMRQGGQTRGRPLHRLTRRPQTLNNRYPESSKTQQKSQPKTH